MTSLEKKLKNPVWYSLKETHHKFMIEFDGVLFYHPDICVFGSFYDASKIKENLTMVVVLYLLTNL